VGSTSAKYQGRSEIVPGAMVPGQDAMDGERTPPS